MQNPTIAPTNGYVISGNFSFSPIHRMKNVTITVNTQKLAMGLVELINNGTIAAAKPIKKYPTPPNLGRVKYEVTKNHATNNLMVSSGTFLDASEDCSSRSETE